MSTIFLVESGKIMQRRKMVIPKPNQKLFEVSVERLSLATGRDLDLVIDDLHQIMSSSRFSLPEVRRRQLLVIDCLMWVEWEETDE